MKIGRLCFHCAMFGLGSINLDISHYIVTRINFPLPVTKYL